MGLWIGLGLNSVGDSHTPLGSPMSWDCYGLIQVGSPVLVDPLLFFSSKIAFVFLYLFGCDVFYFIYSPHKYIC